MYLKKNQLIVYAVLQGQYIYIYKLICLNKKILILLHNVSQKQLGQYIISYSILMNPFPLRVLCMWINIYHLNVATKVPNMKRERKR